MNHRKTTSTNYQNEQNLIRECPMTYTYSMLGKRWKPIIIWKINDGDDRFSSLLKSIPIISRKVLYEELVELQERELVEAIPKGKNKHYQLTSLGESLLPLLKEMWAWGERHRELCKPLGEEQESGKVA